jgi:hypothetical protein
MLDGGAHLQYQWLSQGIRYIMDENKVAIWERISKKMLMKFMQAGRCSSWVSKLGRSSWGVQVAVLRISWFPFSDEVSLPTTSR